MKMIGVKRNVSHLRPLNELIEGVELRSANLFYVGGKKNTANYLRAISQKVSTEDLMMLMKMVALMHESRTCKGHTVGAETSRVFEGKQAVKQIV